MWKYCLNLLSLSKRFHVLPPQPHNSLPLYLNDKIYGLYISKTIFQQVYILQTFLIVQMKHNSNLNVTTHQLESENENCKIFNPIPVGPFYTNEPVGGGANQPPLLKFFGAPLKSKFFGIYFIGLKWSLGIFRKSQQVSALNFYPKGPTVGFSERGG